MGVDLTLGLANLAVEAGVFINDFKFGTGDDALTFAAFAEVAVDPKEMHIDFGGTITRSQPWMNPFSMNPLIGILFPLSVEAGLALIFELLLVGGAPIPQPAFPLRTRSRTHPQTHCLLSLLYLDCKEVS